MVGGGGKSDKDLDFIDDYLRRSLIDQYIVKEITEDLQDNRHIAGAMSVTEIRYQGRMKKLLISYFDPSFTT